MSNSSRSHRRAVRYAVASLTIGLAAGIATFPAHSDDINEQVAEASDDLAKADAKVDAAIKQLETAREQLPQARKELAAAQSELTQAQQRKSAADVKVAEAIAKVAKAKQEIAETEQQIAYLEQRIGRMAREVYQQGGQISEVEILLDSRDPGDFAARLEALRSIAQDNNSTMTDLDDAKAQLQARLAGLKILEQEAEQAQAEAQQEVDKAAAAKARADAAKAKIDELVAARSSALRDARERKADVRKQYNQLQAEQDRIAAIARAAAAKAQLPVKAASPSTSVPAVSPGRPPAPRCRATSARACIRFTAIARATPAPTSVRAWVRRSSLRPTVWWSRSRTVVPTVCTPSSSTGRGSPRCTPTSPRPRSMWARRSSAATSWDRSARRVGRPGRTCTSRCT
jgi:peptidoglycan hydrolase CwlO-like protein